MNAQLTFVANLKGKGENCWPTEQTCLACVSLSYRIVKPFSIKTTKSDPFGQDIGLTWNMPPTVTLRRIPSSTSNPKKILLSTFRFSVKWIQTQAVLPSVCHSNHWATDRSLDYFPQNKLVIFGDFFKGTFNNHPSDRITVCLSPAHIYCKDTSGVRRRRRCLFWQIVQIYSLRGTIFHIFFFSGFCSRCLGSILDWRLTRVISGREQKNGSWVSLVWIRFPWLSLHK